MQRRTVIALTMGDAAGIGPELVVRALTAPQFKGRIDFAVYGSRSVFDRAWELWGGGTGGESAPGSFREAGELKFGDFAVGEADPRCGRLAYDGLTLAVEDTLKGDCAAIVTAPMNKYSVNLAGIAFTGHTERIAELAGVRDFVMMQSAGALRMTFVTCHVPLARVPGLITVERVKMVSRLLWQAVRQEGVAAPKLACAALNPHAGENSCMGDEEARVIIPALESLRAEGVDIAGPFPPDVLFIGKVRERFDGLVTMYHDQGHIPFKMLAFDRGVNSTLNLPFCRTSPDHGTAFDIAWRGVADCSSFFAAIEVAFARSRR